MQKYWSTFRISFSRQLAYRLNFVLSLTKELILLLLLFYIWKALAGTSGNFASFTYSELLGYLFAVHIFRHFVFGPQSSIIAKEINSGIFATFLTKPINHFWYCYMRELADRISTTVAAIIEITIVLTITHLPAILNLYQNISWVLLCIFTAHFLYFCLTYCINILSFWSREIDGPRYLFEWLTEIASGTFFPISIMAPAFVSTLKFLPFYSLLYSPVMLLLGKTAYANPKEIFISQGVWLIIILFCTAILWKRGIKRFTGEGI